MAHLDLETWRGVERERYNSEVTDPGADYTGPCLDKLSKKMLAGMHPSIRNMNYSEAVKCVFFYHQTVCRNVSSVPLHRQHTAMALKVAM